MTAMPLSDQIWYGQKRGSWGSATPHSRARGLIVPKICWDIPTYVQTVWPYTNQIWYGNAMYTTRLLHDDLHWLDVPERIQYKIGVTVHCCVQSKVPKYLTVALQSQRLSADATYTRPVDITCQYHVTGSVPSAVESLCCRPNVLELFTGQSSRPGSQQQQLQVTI